MDLSNNFFISATEAAEVVDSDIIWDRIVSIDCIDYEHVYDMEVEGTHNFIGNGIYAHNTYISEDKPTTLKAPDSDDIIYRQIRDTILSLYEEKKELEQFSNSLSPHLRDTLITIPNTKLYDQEDGYMPASE